MRTVIFHLLILVTLSCFSQKSAAIVSVKDKTAYIDMKGDLTYIESIDPAINETICTFKNGYARVRRTGKFQFIDETGKQLFKTSFDKAEDFFEGLAEVKVDFKWGFINKKGEFVIKPTFYEVQRFSCGLSAVALSPSGRHGYIDTTGKIVIPLAYDRAHTFIDNKAWVMRDGKWGLINKYGKYIIEPLYVEVANFSEGYTWVKNDGLWGMIDTTGNYLIKPNERNTLVYGQNANNKIFFEFHNGLLKYQANNKFGFLDRSLKVRIPAQYGAVTYFENNRACVKLDGYWGLVDTTGRYVIQPNYKDMKLSTDGWYPTKDDDTNKWGYLNENKEWIIKPQFKTATPFQFVNQ